jgi:hypothetical protein
LFVPDWRDVLPVSDAFDDSALVPVPFPAAPELVVPPEASALPLCPELAPEVACRAGIPPDVPAFPLFAGPLSPPALFWFNFELPLQPSVIAPASSTIAKSLLMSENSCLFRCRPGIGREVSQSAWRFMTLLCAWDSG